LRKCRVSARSAANFEFCIRISIARRICYTLSSLKPSKNPNFIHSAHLENVGYRHAVRQTLNFVLGFVHGQWLIKYIFYFYNQYKKRF
ncbi:MAG: hypothetical protein RR413_01435, partial [Christensenellaceae bacterium]